VFAVGLGLNQLEDKLVEIADVTNGVAEITGDLSGDNEFLLQKLYVQILSDVSDSALVMDPRTMVPPGEERATDVYLGTVDVEADFIVALRSTPIHPKYTEIWLEAPDGTTIREQDAGSMPNLAYVEGDAHAYFRMQFPPFPDHPGSQAGRWRIWVANRWGRGNRGAKEGADRGLLVYSAMCKARSDLKLGGRLEQTRFWPGSEMTVVLEPTVYGRPLGLGGSPVIRVERPDGKGGRVRLSRHDDGAYRGTFRDTHLVGRYLFSAEVSATSPGGDRVTRFRTMTGIVFRPERGTGDGPDRSAEVIDHLKRLERLIEECCGKKR
jgi:hypothetical protein